MPALTNPAERKVIEEALSDWNGGHGLRWLRLAVEYLDKLGISQQEAGRTMYEYVRGGGQVDRALETREGWRDRHKYHYDLRLNLCEEEMSYVEMRLIEDSRVDPPYLLVVNAKRK